MNNTPNNSIDRVLEKIEQGKVHMQPKVFFILRMFALAFAAFVIFVLSAFIASFVLFSIHESGELFLLGFGWRGVFMFLLFFPWVFFALDLLAIIALRALMQNFRMFYRLSFTTVLGVIILASTALALLINLTPLHTTLRNQASHEGVPFVGHFYTGIRVPHEKNGEFRGFITSIEGRTFMLKHDLHDTFDDDHQLTVHVPSSLDITPYVVGDNIYVAGDEEHGVVEAYGIGKINPASGE
jgi:hypothetical protein